MGRAPSGDGDNQCFPDSQHGPGKGPSFYQWFGDDVPHLEMMCREWVDGLEKGMVIYAGGDDSQ